MYYYSDYLYFLLVIVIMAIGFGAQAYVNSQLKKFAKVPSSSGLTGVQAAEQMLRMHGVYGVQVKMGKEGQDHFDPKTNSISLSPSVYQNSTVTSYATACHEAGHALQFATSYGPLKMRTALFPAAQVASQLWFWALLIGVLLQSLGLIYVAIILYVAVVAFQLVTLPVEFNASNRALTYIKNIGQPEAEVQGATSVLRACALTYVAAALASVLQLLYLLARSRN